jgi:hypothetical protein
MSATHELLVERDLFYPSSHRLPRGYLPTARSEKFVFRRGVYIICVEIEIKLSGTPKNLVLTYTSIRTHFRRKLRTQRFSRAARHRISER